MNDSLPNHDIVLLGAGHTNAHIIRMWRMNPIPSTRLTCVSDHTIATYSGMLAGTLAGQYVPDEMEIDLIRLCASCGVRFIHAQTVGLDLADRRLLLQNRPAVKFDLLSIGIGSRPVIPPGGKGGLSIKPMQTFRSRLMTTINKTLLQRAGETARLVVVGGGAAGVEVAFCLNELLKQKNINQSQLNMTLVEAAGELLAEMPPRTGQLAIREFQRRGISLRLNSRISRIENDKGLVFEDGQEMAADIILWATSAKPPELLDTMELPRDERGFLLTRNTLQSTGSANVFAVGDTGTVQGEKYAKAGVYAVRQGPLLWENLRRKLQGDQLLPWQPQSSFLSLIGTGDDRAILTYRGFSFHAKWCWQLKDWIDSKFVAKYQRYDPPRMMPTTQNGSGEYDLSNQCGGCGSKASARVLQKGLSALSQPSYAHVLMGLDSPDDIALIANQRGPASAISTDFFTPFGDDPFLIGRIAALNALSDFYAKGAIPRAALSIAILPAGSEEQQAKLLEDLLAGAVCELGPAEVPIVGGHTIVGPKLTFGFTILGDADTESVPRKATLSLGDSLVLTKPLGTGVLLAAHMQAACRADWWTPLIKSMLQSNREAAALAREAGVSAATDVTGFGLAGHLLEMLSSSPLSAEISLHSLPLLPGVQALLERGYESTLAPSNRQSYTEILLSPKLQEKSLTKILFDPQTSGGLLLTVSGSHLKQLLAKGGKQMTMIGKIVDGRIAEDSGPGKGIHLVP